MAATEEFLEVDSCGKGISLDLKLETLYYNIRI